MAGIETPIEAWAKWREVQARGEVEGEARFRQMQHEIPMHPRLPRDRDILGPEQAPTGATRGTSRQ